MKNYVLEVEGLDHCTLNGKRPQKTIRHSRYVHFFDDVVVKLTWGEYQIRNEVRAWETVKDTPHAKYFAEVLDHGEKDGAFYVIQKRVKSRPYDSIDNWGTLESRILEICDEYGITDMHDENWVVSEDGTPVVVDMAVMY